MRSIGSGMLFTGHDLVPCLAPFINVSWAVNLTFPPPLTLPGVYCSGKRWRVTIKRDGAQRYLGVFETKEEAVAAIESYDNGEAVPAVKSKAAAANQSRVKGM